MEGKPLKPYTGQDSKLGLSFGGGKVTGYKRHHHRKRSFPFPKNNPAKIRRTSQSMSLKAPLVALNEKYGKVEFDIKPKGEGFDAGFEARFLHNGQEYVGYGISKKSAKTEAAKKCLQFNEIPYLEIPDKGEILSAGGEKPASPIVRESEPFSYFPEGYTDFSEDAATAEIPQLTKPIENKEVDLQRAVESPSMVLNELIPGLSKRLEWVETKSKTKFCCRINLRGHTFEGTGLGKKAARKKLANNVLSKFFGIRFPTKGKSISGEDKKASVLGKMHAYARVKHIDPSSKYEFENISDGDKLLYKAKLFMCGKEYECVHSEREKAKFQVAKLGLKDNEDTEKSNLTIVERIIDTSKHPFQMFHEYYGSPELMEQELTDKKIPYFLQGVMIDGQYIVAEASSKKRAKVKLALKVFERNHGINIDAWNSLKDDIKAEYLAEKDNPDPQIALSNLTDVDVLTDIDEISNQQVYPPRGVPMVLPTGNQGQCEKNSVSILNELHPGVDFVYTEENFGNNRIQYKCVVTVGEKTFDGDGYSKKAAKLVAASKALEVIYGIDASTNEIGMKTSHNNFDISVEFADKVLDAINAKFSSVFQSDTPYKVIASVVMTKEVGGAMIDAFEILSIATGTKCISGESINCSGQVLNDCHAEVIAGRGLRQFFFDQLHLAASDKESCFQRVPDSQLFQMKPDLHLFLYINTAPCGDGRVYSVEVSSNNKTVGILRTKVENGQGTIPVPEAGLQTTDGILAGERLLTMSCSDKLMKWNVLGIQGSILTNFMKPVYLTGLIVGDKYHYEHFTRSLYSRVVDVQGLPPPFKVVRPDFGTPSKKESRNTSKATNNSYNWYYGQTTMEVINGVTGRTPVATPSRLSKSTSYKKYCELMEMTKIKQVAASYHDAKEQATGYQTSKHLLFKHLEEKGYGKWVGKPAEQDTFH